MKKTLTTLILSSFIFLGTTNCNKTKDGRPQRFLVQYLYVDHLIQEEQRKQQETALTPTNVSYSDKSLGET